LKPIFSSDHSPDPKLPVLDAKINTKYILASK